MNARFCETDSRFLQPVQETQLAANVVTTHLYQRIVLCLEPPESLPVHCFGLAAIAVSNVNRTP